MHDGVMHLERYMKAAVQDNPDWAVLRWAFQWDHARDVIQLSMTTHDGKVYLHPHFTERRDIEAGEPTLFASFEQKVESTLNGRPARFLVTHSPVDFTIDELDQAKQMINELKNGSPD